MVALTTEAERPIATLRDRRTGEVEQLRPDWVVGADGAHSTVRDALGIAMTGPTDVSHNVNILFEADLAAHLTDRLSAVYTVQRPELHGTFLAVDSDRRWLFNLVVDGGPPADLDNRAAADLIRSAAGLADLHLTIVAQQVWRAAARIADRFQAGRVLLAGDAAHVTTPYGGFGLNCGIADADNLAWKLAAVYHGRAWPALLDTYAAERRPVAELSVAESHTRLVDAMAAHRTGAAPTARPSEGLVLGYHYTSAAVIADSSPAPPGDPVADYEPVGRPGHRLPHLWLGQPQRTSTLDLLDPLELTVLAGRDADWCPAWPVTRRIGTADLPDPDDAFLDLCGIGPNGAVLVRPDGHIAWRAPARPADGADALVDAAGRILSATPSARPTSPARNVPPGGNRDHPADDRI